MLEEISGLFSIFIGLFGIFIAIILVLTSNISSKIGTIMQKMDNFEDSIQRSRGESTILPTYLYLTALAREAKFWEKLSIQRADKVLIASTIASKCIQENETIIVDSGTTIDQIPHILREKNFNIKIYTNNLLAAISVVPPVEGFQCFLLPGKLDAFYGATYDIKNLEKILKAITANEIILSTTAISFEHGPLVKVDDYENREFKRGLVKEVLGTDKPRLIIAADWTKFILDLPEDLNPVLDEVDWKTVRYSSHFYLVVTEPPSSLEKTPNALIARQVIEKFIRNKKKKGMNIEICKRW